MSETDREVTITIRGKNLTDPAFKGVRENLLGLWKDTDRVSASTRAAKPGLDGLGVSAKGLFAELERGRGSLKGFGGGIESGASSMMGMVRSSGLLRLGLIGGGAAGVVGALGAVAHWASESAQEIRGIASATDLSVPFIQRLSVVAASSGKTVQQFTDTLQTFGQRVAGGEDSVVRASEKLGVSWLELRKQSPEAQLDTLIPKLAAVGDAQERNRLINELFGKSGKETIPKLIQNWEELKVAVVTSTDEQLAVFDRWESATVRMAENWKTRTRNMIADAMLMAEEMATGFANAGKNIASGVHTVTTGGIRTGLFNMFGRAMEGQGAAIAAQTPFVPKEKPLTQGDLLSREDAKAAALTKAALEEIRISKLRGVADDDLRVKFGLTRQEMAAVERRISSMTAAQREATQADKARAEELKRVEERYQAWKRAELGVSDAQREVIENEERLIHELAAASRGSGWVNDGGRERFIEPVALSNYLMKLLPLTDQTKKLTEGNAHLTASLVAVGDAYYIAGQRAKEMFFQMGRQSDLKSLTAGAMSVKDLEASTNIPPDRFVVSLRNLMSQAPQTMLAALQGGGHLGNSLAGMLTGGMLGSQSFMGKLGTEGLQKGLYQGGAGKMLQGVFGNQFGGALAGMIPGIGMFAGPAISALIGGAKRLAGVNATKGGREGLAKELGFGNLDKLYDDLSSLGDAGAKLAHIGKNVVGRNDEAANRKWMADVQQFYANIEGGADKAARKAAEAAKLQREALADQADAQQFLTATIEKYGFTVDELGPKWRAQRLKEEATLLLKEYTALTASGVDHETVQKKMGRNLFDFLQTAKRTGAEVPLEFKKIAEEALRLGTAVGENGEQLQDLNGITWAETFSQSIDRVVTKLDELIRKITGDLGTALEGTAGALTGTGIEEGAEIPSAGGGFFRPRGPEHHAALGGLFSGPANVFLEHGRKEMVGDELFFERILDKVSARRGGVGGGDINVNLTINEINARDAAGVGQAVRQAVRDGLVPVLAKVLRTSGRARIRIQNGLALPAGAEI